jgi:hypothetical protein
MHRLLALTVCTFAIAFCVAGVMLLVLMRVPPAGSQRVSGGTHATWDPTWVVVSGGFVVFAVCIVGIVLLIWMYRHVRRITGQTEGFTCPRCLHDLSGAPTGNCPECGQDVAYEDLPALWRASQSPLGFRET